MNALACGAGAWVISLRVSRNGAVGADVVIATFFNFFPDLVRRAIPAAWQHAAPTGVVDARLGAADAALRRMLGDAITTDAMREAADLARAATAGCFPEGRPLYAGHAAQPWPDDPHLVLRRYSRRCPIVAPRNEATARERRNLEQRC